VSTLFIHLLTKIVKLPNITFKSLSSLFSLSIYVRLADSGLWRCVVSRCYEEINCLNLQGLLRGPRMIPCMHGGETDAHIGHAKGVGVRWQAITDYWQVGYGSDGFRTCDHVHRAHVLTTKFVVHVLLNHLLQSMLKKWWPDSLYSAFRKSLCTHKSVSAERLSERTVLQEWIKTRESFCHFVRTFVDIFPHFPWTMLLFLSLQSSITFLVALVCTSLDVAFRQTPCFQSGNIHCADICT
jgi:hypothetical protein